MGLQLRDMQNFVCDWVERGVSGRKFYKLGFDKELVQISRNEWFAARKLPISEHELYRTKIGDVTVWTGFYGRSDEMFETVVFPNPWVYVPRKTAPTQEAAIVIHEHTVDKVRRETDG